MIPKEHGAWPIILISILAGILYSGRVFYGQMLFAASVMSFFLLYLPVYTFIGDRVKQKRLNIDALRWILIYFVSGVVFASVAIPLNCLINYNRIAIFSALIFSISVLLSVKAKMSFGRNVVAAIGMTFTAPAMYFYSTQIYSVEMFRVWLYCLIVFVSAVMYVQSKMKGKDEPKGKLLFALSLGFAVVAFIWAIFHVLTVNRDIFIVISILPQLIYLITQSVLKNNNVSLKTTGLRLLMFDLIFLFGFILQSLVG